MFKKTFLFLFSCIFSLTNCLHFLGGSFTYKHIHKQRRTPDAQGFRSTLVEIRFHISKHFFLCTSEQINEHLVVYLIGENVPYDNQTKQYLWNQSIARKEQQQYYNIKCVSEKQNSACQNFQEQTWAYCEGMNEKNGYSIIKRQFLLNVEDFRPLHLYYSACCWANSPNRNFYFNLSIDTYLARMNSSPYPQLPVSYHVPFNKSTTIKILAFDRDNDEILCQPYQEDFSRFLTVNVDDKCIINYKADQAGQQFGQFWLMDRSGLRILSRSLISIQVQVLETSLCDSQPVLFLSDNGTRISSATIALNESVSLTAQLHPGCLLIQPDDQTITEITTLCTYHQANILKSGGIEILFQCQLSLCETYHICFVGEFGLKLPATSVECVSVTVTSSDEECTKAMNEYNFTAPRNRQLITSEPLMQKAIETEFPTRKWLLVLFVYLAFLLIGIILYCGCKEMLLLFYRRSSRKRSVAKRTRTVSEPHPETTHHERTPIEPLLPKFERFPSKEVPGRTQYLRLGSVSNSKK